MSPRRSARSISPWPTGAAIPIEERPAAEVREINGRLIVPPAAKVRNPAFDVTPARYITAIITEKGIARPPYDIEPEALRQTTT